MNKKIDGLIAAPFTPFHQDGSLNLDMVKPLALHLQKSGASGAFVCGTTGEGVSMTSDERKQVAARWRQELPAPLKVIVHVGDNSLGRAQDLARHAEQIGADAIAAIAPNFFRPASVNDLVDWCAGIASAAPKTPFYYYHMPAMSGVNFAMADFLPLAAAKIPSFGGIKFTHENLMDYAQCVVLAGDKYSILFGRDEILLSALALGAKGAVGSTYNYACPIYNRVIKAFESGDRSAAAAAQMESINFIVAFCRQGGMAGGKAIMAMIGLDCGPVRAPIANLTPAQVATLKADLEKIGFFKAVAC